MHVAVIGAGAIGTVLAAAGCDSGHAVTVCTRTPVDTLILERDGDRTGTAGRPSSTIRPTPPRAPGSGPADVIWVATKVATRPGRHPGWTGSAGTDTLVAAAQNGLDHHARLIPFVRSAGVVPGLAYVAAERIGPGRVVHLGGDRMVVPRARPRPSSATPSRTGLVVRGTRRHVDRHLAEAARQPGRQPDHHPDHAPDRGNGGARYRRPWPVVCCSRRSKWAGRKGPA